MFIVSKPRQIRVDLDPDLGFPVGIVVESVRFVEENGVNIGDLGVNIESFALDSPQALAALDGVASDATAALMLYQEEVQRLAGELSAAQSENESLRAQLAQ